MRYLASKLAVPAKMPHLINRPRIVRRLGSRNANLLLLLAPAGYGKTILALQLLELVVPPRRAWLDLDARDGDPRRFAGYFIESLAHGIPELRLTRIQGAAISGGMPLAQVQHRTFQRPSAGHLLPERFVRPPQAAANKTSRPSGAGPSGSVDLGGGGFVPAMDRGPAHKARPCPCAGSIEPGGSVGGFVLPAVYEGWSPEYAIRRGGSAALPLL